MWQEERSADVFVCTKETAEKLVQIIDCARKVRAHRPNARNDPESATVEPEPCANWQAGREARGTADNDKRACFGYDFLVCMVGFLCVKECLPRLIVGLLSRSRPTFA
jgi:hypothetical protein